MRLQPIGLQSIGEQDDVEPTRLRDAWENQPNLTRIENGVSEIPARRLHAIDELLSTSLDRFTVQVALTDRSAHRRNDQLHQILAHGWMTPRSSGIACTDAQRRALVARSGLRATNLDWLRPPRTPPVDRPPADTLAVGPLRPERAFSRVD